MLWFKRFTYNLVCEINKNENEWKRKNWQLIERPLNCLIEYWIMIDWKRLFKKSAFIFIRKPIHTKKQMNKQKTIDERKRKMKNSI